MTNNNASMVAVNVGNTRTGIALFQGKELQESLRVVNTELGEISKRIAGLVGKITGNGEGSGGSGGVGGTVVVASVNGPVCGSILKEVRDILPDVEIMEIGVDCAAPVGQQLEPEAIVGPDRLLNAAAAFDVLGGACVVIDAGTAVTVDFVDGKGTFHGGAIGPGAQKQLDILHAGTDQLPELDFVAPRDQPFGANTSEAMLQGVFYGIRGMVRHLIERYAEAYEAYPAVIATGGDAKVLFENDELIEHVDEDLALRGIAAAYRRAFENIEEIERES